MNMVLWATQALLALLFLVAGGLKVLRPPAALRGMMPWVEDVSRPTVIGIGVVELLGAIGLIVPGATGVAPFLTPLAASGFAVLMIGATATHLRRGEGRLIGGNLVVLLLAGFVAYGRLGPWPT
ncbi:DoxX family protein [Micromonospora sp. NPDC047620]|uniref:DoxX family protein n=1 Tax=Micromonospora sp. NPDC047620 TaxID=3364251 RepID=UPI003718E85F